MKNFILFLCIVFSFTFINGLCAQTLSININNTFNSDQIILSFDTIGIDFTYGLKVNGSVTLNNDTSLVRVILVDNNNQEYLIFEAFQLLTKVGTSYFSGSGDETYYLEDIEADYVKIEVVGASINITTMLIDTTYNSNIPTLRTQYINNLRQNKIDSINNNIQEYGFLWLAGDNDFAQRSFNDKKNLFSVDKLPNLNGFEYYKGGIFQMPNFQLVEKSNIVDNFDWRDRHGSNWITPIKNQNAGGTYYPACISYASLASLEAIINLFYNKQLNYVLSEQALVSCRFGIYRTESVQGWPTAPFALCNNNSRTECLFRELGALDDSCYLTTYLWDCWGLDTTSGAPCPMPSPQNPFPANYNNCTLCGNLCLNYLNRLWKIDDFKELDAPSSYNSNCTFCDTISETKLKENIILNGPVSFTRKQWGHDMTFIGFGIISENQLLYYLNYQTPIVIQPNDTSIGKVFWIAKNCWGTNWGEDGYCKMLINLNTQVSKASIIETPITPSLNSGLSNADIQCTDTDGDGYYWWGIGGGPFVPAATCPLYTPAASDCDDSDPLVGPYDNAYNCTPICLFNNVSTDIDDDRIIDHNEYITTNITVKSGHKLTIVNNATLFIHPLSQIVVEDGAELFLNNGSIKICSDAAWQGTITAGTGAVVKIENESVFVDKIISEWMPLNMNVGTMGTPSNDGIIQKYCYDNSEANCLLYGALYTWNEAMQYAASVNCDPCGPTTGKGGVQGICPTGFHIPSDKEWSRYEWRMENYITPTGTTSLSTFQNNIGSRGSITQNVGPGDKMKATSGWSGGGNGTNTSGFTAIPSGWFGNGFQSLGSATYLWSATEYNSSTSFNRALSSNSGQSMRQSNGKTLGFSVRCLKDK